MINDLGYKAIGLGLLKKSGLNVPGFIVVPSSLLISSSNIKEDVIKEIDGILQPFFKQYPNTKYIVRSSANIEDSENHSFSGAFKSIKNVNSKEVINAIISVQKSIYDKSIISLCNHLSIEHNSIKISCIVQVQKEMDYGGVIFSIDPIKGNPNHCVIGISKNGPEYVVEGRGKIDSIVFDRLTLRVLEGMNNPYEIIKEISALDDKITTLENEINNFADIEFGVLNNEIYFFQVRPLNKVPEFRIMDDTPDGMKLMYNEQFSPLGASIELIKINSYYSAWLNKKYKNVDSLFMNRFGFLLYRKPSISFLSTLYQKIRLHLESEKIRKDFRLALIKYRKDYLKIIDECSNSLSLEEVKSNLKNIIEIYISFQKKSLDIGILSNFYPSIYYQYMKLYNVPHYDALRFIYTPLKEKDYLYIDRLIEPGHNSLNYTFDNPKDVGFSYHKSKVRSEIVKETMVDKKPNMYFDVIKKYLFKKSKLYFRYKDLRNLYFHEGVIALRKCLLHYGSILSSEGLLDNKHEVFILDYKDLFLNKVLLKQRINIARKRKNLLKRQKFTFSTNQNEKRSNIIKGLSCSGGKYKGVVRKIGNLNDLKDNKIEILFCYSLTPNWYYLFPHIKALILVEGYALSHGANIAREFGIPAVANIPWDSINDLSIVTVDGFNGEIYFG